MDAVAIVNAGTPVLCVDTCAVLDLMRDPTRDSSRPAIRRAGVELIDIAERGGLILLMADQVGVELAAHIDAVQAETGKAVQRLKDQVAQVEAIAAAYGAQGPSHLGHLDDHADRARAVVDRWLQQAVLVTPTAGLHAKAFTRVNGLRAPARQGKDSTKDCLVFETYLEAISSLRGAGCAAKVVFVSSNTSDYLGTASVMRPEITADLTPLNVAFAVSMEHAMHALGL